MPRQKKLPPPRLGPPNPDPQQTPIEDASVTEPAEPPPMEPEPAKPKFRKYLVNCKYHTRGNIAYRIYAANENDAEEIARLRFREDETNHSRELDRATAVRVVND
jgi:hypothetical protein